MTLQTEISVENRNLVEAEQKILGIAMHSPNALVEIFTSLECEDFFLSQHKIIYEAMLNLSRAGKTVSSTTVIDQLENSKVLQKIGGVEEIEVLSSTFYGDETLNDLIDIVFNKSIGRKFDNTLVEIKKLRDTNPDFGVVLNQAQSNLLKINLSYKKESLEPLAKSVETLITKIEQLEKNPAEITGVSSGFKKLDKMTSGFQRGDLIILAARPSMGKTAFALNLALKASSHFRRGTKNGNAVAIFSIEMSKEQLAQRILSSMTGVEAFKLRTGQNLSVGDWRKIQQANEKLQAQKLFIDDNPSITIQQLQAKLHKLKRDEQIDLCVVDYLQLIQTPGSNGENRQNEISNISRQLKRIARDLEIPIICLSQLSRSVEKREDRRPMMSDLRDSGAIEQDADIVMFLYREDYYQHKIRDDNNTLEGSIQETELIISKHRNGAIGTIKLGFNLEYGKFTDIL